MWGMNKLSQHLTATGLTQQAFAEKVNVTQPTVNRWLNGARPSWEKAAEIERVTDGAVPMLSWIASDQGSAA